MSETIDTEFLFRLAGDKSAEGRSVLAKIITELFDNRGEALSDRERSLIFKILHGIIHEIEVSVRKNLSTQLASLPDVPPELVNNLANDNIDVAYPILTRSKVVRDIDLIDVIRLRTHEHQIAITLRDEISEEVSDALVETGHEGVIKSLLKNQNARISRATMEYLVEQSKRVDTYQEPLLHRHDLKEDLAKRMFMWVSAALRQHIVDRYAIDPQTIDHLLEQAALEESEKTVSTRRRMKGGAKKLAVALNDVEMVTPEILVEALSDGEVALFLALFAELTGLKRYLAARILFEAGGEGLAIACKAVGIGEIQFANIFSMSRKAKPNVAKTLRRDLRVVLDLYQQIPPGAARAVLRQWQLGSNYLAAIKGLQSDG